MYGGTMPVSSQGSESTYVSGADFGWWHHGNWARHASRILDEDGRPCWCIDCIVYASNHVGSKKERQPGFMRFTKAAIMNNPGY